MSTASVYMKDTPKDDFVYTSQTVRIKSKLNLLTVSMLAIVMLFAGLTSAYIVSSGDAYWVVLNLPDAFGLSTLLIVISSVTMLLAQMGAKRGNQNMVRGGLVMTLILGVAFCFTQWQAWGQLFATGNAVVGNIEQVQGNYGTDFTVVKGDQTLVFEGGQYYMPDDPTRSRPVTDRVVSARNTASSYIYVFTAVHILHVFGGVIALLVMTLLGLRGAYTTDNHLGLRLGARYWHFMGGLWVYLFLFLYLIH